MYKFIRIISSLVWRVEEHQNIAPVMQGTHNIPKSKEQHRILITTEVYGENV